MRDHMAKAREIVTQFPRLRARLGTAAADYGAVSEGNFEFGLQAIRYGLEAQLTARRTQRTRRCASHPATAKNHWAARGWPHEERNHLARVGDITG